MTNKQGCALLVLFCLVGCVLGSTASVVMVSPAKPTITPGGPTGTPKPTKPPWSESAAIIACRDYVRLNLTYPSTAKFSLWSTESKEYKGGYFTVRGTVKAKNAFGLELEFNYFCNVRYSNGRYVLEDLEVF